MFLACFQGFFAKMMSPTPARGEGRPYPGGIDPVHRYVTDKDGQILELDPVQDLVQSGTPSGTGREALELTCCASGTYKGRRAREQSGTHF